MDSPYGKVFRSGDRGTGLDLSVHKGATIQFLLSPHICVLICDHLRETLCDPELIEGLRVPQEKPASRNS